MQVRRGKAKDIPRILELLRQVNNVHAEGRPDLFIPDKTKYTEEELEGILCDPTTPVFVGVDDSDEVLGYAFCCAKRVIGQNNLVDNLELYIDDICLDESLRGQGLARIIYDEVIHYARVNAFDRVTLHVWECNPSAIRFYEKCGMKPYFHAMEIGL